MYKLALAATIFVDGDFESAGTLGVGDDFVMELAGCNFFDLLDRADGVLAVASASAVLHLDEVGGVFALDNLFSWMSHSKY